MIQRLTKLIWPILLVATLFLVSGCVSLSETMRSWVGKSESELLSRWGAPDSSARTDDGKKVLTWKTLWTDSSGNLETCRQSFTIGTDGKVERWAYSGC